MSNFLTGKLQLECPLLRIFMACAKHGSVTKAAIALDMAQSNVSKKMAEIEALYNMRLFKRQPRGIDLTYEGEILYNGLYEIFSKFSSLETTLDKTANFSARSKPIRIGTTFPLGQFVLPPLLAEFAKTVDVKFELNVFTNLPSTLTDNLDVVIWPFSEEDIEEIKGVTIKKLTTYMAGLYASQNYLDKHGTPQSLKDLKGHKFIAYNDFPNLGFNPNWHIHLLNVHGIPYQTSFSVNNSLLSLKLAESDEGVIAYAHGMIKSAQSKLINIMPEIESKPMHIYLMAPEELKSNKVIILLYNFLTKKLRNDTLKLIEDITKE